MAEENIRSVSVSASAQSPEGCKEKVKMLQEELGDVYVFEEHYDSPPPVEELDKAGLESLRLLAMQ